MAFGGTFTTQGKRRPGRERFFDMNHDFTHELVFNSLFMMAFRIHFNFAPNGFPFSRLQRSQITNDPLSGYFTGCLTSEGLSWPHYHHSANIEQARTSPWRRLTWE
ncbi:hypothetical protein MCOR27_007738 [Pyricularia oryzae]|uniref:Uncharacterized protein n=1 Tax=Pyricularia grisea TaxID=148305 RepID=A0ABQ8NE88_PYRGI|nr:hypothetical protein MCOR01_002664 [Pyricularia oryzae]KAI6295516.1 hypothetical protein MCOR33_007611 [Pyricularia grisea]KAH9433116.1 hypothetical protein MCOR02_007784 [Pyricularia oryzae]KAI6255966.1 hypothetical protein MCOR19_007546 [Pyricularia oryzae]KAI6270598.1 hypothetical protein MCOR26_008168 [Pyricularia oryzae]